MPEPQREGFGSFGSFIQLLVVAWAVLLAALPLNDNSFFTHLATGRLILDDGSVPSSDPYTFTAAGEPWTVQSWLMSVAYAGAERAAGVLGLKLVVAGLFVAAAVLLWRLTSRAPTLLPRVALVGVAMLIASGTWAERPFIVGVVGLGLVLLALENRVPPWTLVPILWVWANSHGSFPLALVLAGLVALGSWLDDRVTPRHELRVLGWIALGTLLGAIGPLGLRALLFPLEAAADSTAFDQIVEWQAPEFRSLAERAFLVLLAGAIVALTRVRTWRAILPVVVFAVAALLARRNVPMATVVLVPAVAASLPALGSLRSWTRTSASRLAAVAGVTFVALSVLAVGVLPGVALGGYPTEALVHVDRTVGEDEVVVTQDFVGNLLEAFDGRDASVYFDDRVDMFPAGVVDDYAALAGGTPAWRQVLDEADADVVVWRRSAPLASLLTTSDEWQIGFATTRWVVAVRR